MAALYEAVTIEWDGKEWEVTPTYRMVQKLEQNVSIAGLAARLEEGQPPISHIAYVIAFLLTQAGKPVSADDVYAAMVTDLDPSQMQSLASVAVSAFVPGKSSGSGEQ